MRLTKTAAILALGALTLSACASAPAEEDITLPSEDNVSQEDTSTPEEPLEGPEVVDEEPDRNSADGRFVSMMLPHHYQGLEMNILADRNTTNPEILALASSMTVAHESELAILDDLFWSWSLPNFTGSSEMEMDSMSDEYSPQASTSTAIRLVHGGDGIDHGNNDYLVDDNPIYAEEYEPTGDRLMQGMLSDTEMIALFNARDTEFDKLWIEGMIMHHEGAVAMAKSHQKNGVYPVLLSLSEQMIETQEQEIEQMQTLLAEMQQ
jgi:uncharacterized protein (DUF305 family)